MSQFKINKSPASNANGPSRRTEVAKVVIVSFLNVTVAEAEVSVILVNTTIEPLWLFYKLMSLIIASVAAGHV